MVGTASPIPCGALARRIDSREFSATGVLLRIRACSTFSATGGSTFSATGVLPLFDRTANFAGDPFSILDCLDTAPFVRRRFSESRQVGQAEQVAYSQFAGAGAAWPGVFDKAQRAQFADAARNVASVSDAELFQISVSDRQPAIVAASVVGELDLEAVENAASRKTEGVHRR